MEKFNIRWTNKFSGEQGFVKSISTKEQHFINTFDQSLARCFKTEKQATYAINQLCKMGEGENNNFDAVILPASVI